MEIKFCDFNGQVGLCGMPLGQGDSKRCKRHRDKTSRTKKPTLGHYFGPSKFQEENGGFQGFKRGVNG